MSQRIVISACRFLLPLAAMVFQHACLASAVLEAARVGSIENENVRVVYHLDSGTFDVMDPRTGATAILAACSKLENWSSTDTNYFRTAEITAVKDRFGAGQRLTVKCAHPGAPTLVVEFTLHGIQDSALHLRAGLVNTTKASLRLKEFYPLSGGIVFPGTDWMDVRTLNGDSGVSRNKVTRDAVRSSANNLLLTCKQSGLRRSLVLGGLKTSEFAKWVQTLPQGTTASPAKNQSGVVAADLRGSDPVGKLVDAGKTCLPEDSFYLDCGTDDPFTALEKYGRQVAIATKAAPNIYDFPTVCAWYAGVWKTKEAQNHPEKSKYQLNTTAGLVAEMDCAKAAGFGKYARVAGRLVPDTYEPINPQGWWDDLHWQRGGYYVRPYETSRKFGQGMHQRGALAFTYFQPTCVGSWAYNLSKDFREQHVDWLCGKDVKRCLDYTLPPVQKHLRNVFAAMRGGIDGLMVDYCDDMWTAEAARGGFADPYVTSTSFYRTFFQLAKTGLGPNSWLHERNLKDPNNDLTIGLVDLQRTSWDTDQITPDMVSRSGLRWYKNRVLYNYDMDSKDLENSWKVEGFSGSDVDGRRMMLTMAYVAASRLLLANSFRDLSSETLHDLSRTFPYPSERRSARPIDAFMNDGSPRVYDFAVSLQWHQVTLYNTTLPTTEASFTVPISGDPVDGALGLDGRSDYYVYDFWNDRLAGRFKGTDALKQTLRPGEARMLSVHAVEPNPQFLSTSRHLMQGQWDLARLPVWDEKSRILSGASKVVGGEPYRIVLAMNGYQSVKASAKNASIRVASESVEDGLAALEINAPENAVVEWKLVCQRLP